VRKKPLPPAPLPHAPTPPALSRDPREILGQADFLISFAESVHGPPMFGDTYDNIIAALNNAPSLTTKSGLLELLFEFGVTDVEGLLFLIRTITMRTAAQALLWAANPEHPDVEFLNYATFCHPYIRDIFVDD
jgi:hypothetical protein